MRKHKFDWKVEQDYSFAQLETALTTAPVIDHSSSAKEFVVSTDASKYAVGATLERDGKPVAYLSHRLPDSEMNWGTGDQELFSCDHDFTASLGHLPARRKVYFSY